MLSGRPSEFSGNHDASEAIILDGQASALGKAVLENRAEPAVRVAGNVYRGGGNEVVPGASQCAVGGLKSRARVTLLRSGGSLP